ncbi:unnamed protein product, partial [Gulo gulo]
RDAALLSTQPVRPPASLAPTCSPSGKAGPLPLSWSLLEAQQSGRKTNPPRELGEGKEESESQQEPESQWKSVGKANLLRSLKHSEQECKGRKKKTQKDIIQMPYWIKAPLI